MVVDAAVRLALMALSSLLSAHDPGIAAGDALERHKAARTCVDAIAAPAVWPGQPEPAPGIGPVNRRWLIRRASGVDAVEVVKVYADGSVLVRLTPAP